MCVGELVGTIEGGTTIPEAAEQGGVSISSVVGFLKLHRETGSVDPAKFGGYKDFKLAESRRSPGFLRDTSNSRHTSWPRRGDHIGRPVANGPGTGESPETDS
jgi:hypothetical protein